MGCLSAAGPKESVPFQSPNQQCLGTDPDLGKSSFPDLPADSWGMGCQTQYVATLNYNLVCPKMLTALSVAARSTETSHYLTSCQHQSVALTRLLSLLPKLAVSCSHPDALQNHFHLPSHTQTNRQNNYITKLLIEKNTPILLFKCLSHLLFPSHQVGPSFQKVVTIMELLGFYSKISLHAP